MGSGAAQVEEAALRGDAVAAFRLGFEAAQAGDLPAAAVWLGAPAGKCSVKAKVCSHISSGG